jgi:hypothetical protein
MILNYIILSHRSSCILIFRSLGKADPDASFPLTEHRPTLPRRLQATKSPRGKTIAAYLS